MCITKIKPVWAYIKHIETREQIQFTPMEQKYQNK